MLRKCNILTILLYNDENILDIDFGFQNKKHVIKIIIAWEYFIYD